MNYYNLSSSVIACENFIPDGYLGLDYNLSSWNNLNWDNIRMEVIEGLAE